MTTETIDTGKIEAFGGQMIGILNGGMLAVMTSIGHHTGLFDTLATLPPSTSHQVAEAAGLNERYVREWLGAMVTGRIVDIDSAGRTYKLPPEHAAMLTRAAGPNNLAQLASMLPQLAQVEDGIVDSFRNGGGVPYSGFPGFQRFMAELSGTIFDASLIEGTLELVPGLKARLQAGADVADICCGSGHAINLMAKTYPNSRFTGFDFSSEGIATARAEAAQLGLTNTTFVEQDVTTLSADKAFDFITIFDAIHDQAKPRTMLQKVAQALRPDGTLLAVDVHASSNLEENMEHPLAPAMYSISTLHCMTVSLAQGGEGLGTMWGEQKARELLGEAGLVVREVKQVEGDMLNSYFICAKA